MIKINLPLHVVAMLVAAIASQAYGVVAPIVNPLRESIAKAGSVDANTLLEVTLTKEEFPNLFEVIRAFPAHTFAACNAAVGAALATAAADDSGLADYLQKKSTETDGIIKNMQSVGAALLGVTL